VTIFLVVALLISVTLNLYQALSLRELKASVNACEGQIACIRQKLAEVQDAVGLDSIESKKASRHPHLYKVTEETK
jgi:hypothetical protein